MTNQEIFELISRFEGSSIRTMKLADNGFSIELSKDTAQTRAPAAAPVSVLPAQASCVSAAPAASSESIKAPLAGVYYAASAPGSKPYVAIGDHVKAGQTVCLMEAMKMISEIPAPCDCIITEILKENGTLAAFDEPLFRCQPC